MYELEKRKVKAEFDSVNAILKEVSKQLRLFKHFKAQNLTVFTLEDAQNFVNKLLEILNLIRTDKAARQEKIKKMAGQIDEEDMEYYYEDLEAVDKGLHHIMEINGALMQNQGHELSTHIGQTLLPAYAQVLLSIPDRKDYELIDSVCFVCDCLEHGTMEFFHQVQGQGAAKFLELSHHTAKAAEVNYDLLQSCIFALGVVAQRSPNGQFAQLSDTLAILSQTCVTEVPDKITEDDKESYQNMVDNSISTLFKIVLYQNDGGALVTADLITKLLTVLLPLKNDVEEAVAVHTVFL